MADKTYIVRASNDAGNPVTARFGYVRNRSQVEDAAMEGRVILPLAEYVEQGQQVELDPAHPYTVKAVESGVIEVPGASEERRKRELQSELDRIQAEQDRLSAEQKSVRSSKSGG